MNTKSIYFTATIPSVKALVEPDPGYLFADLDLAQADAQVVAWDAGAEKLKELFRNKVDVHTENAKVIFGACDGKKDPRRQIAKPFVHGTNYYATPNELAKRIGLTVHQVDEAQKRWFAHHPEIRKWQQDKIRQLQTRRYVENAFGMRKYWLGRIDQKSAHNEAIAWVPQSTVVRVIDEVAINFTNRWSQEELAVLLQVHDSLDIQVRKDIFLSILPEMERLSLIEIPYPGDPLIIPTGIKISEKSWADCKESWTFKGVSGEGWRIAS